MDLHVDGLLLVEPRKRSFPSSLLLRLYVLLAGPSNAPPVQPILPEQGIPSPRPPFLTHSPLPACIHRGRPRLLSSPRGVVVIGESRIVWILL